jgi:hypothetical protein
VRAIADHIIEEMKKEGVRRGHVEGVAGWALGADRLHRLRRARLPSRSAAFYQLEALWGDAPRLDLEDVAPQRFALIAPGTVHAVALHGPDRGAPEALSPSAS